MSIKYAEITIIRNLEEENIFRSLSRFIGYENITNDKDTIIISFDDGTICDTRDEYDDKKFEFSMLGHDHWFPIYFTVDYKLKTLFYKKPELKNGEKRLDFRKIFKECKNYYSNQYEKSMYNMIYESALNIELFAICRINSNEEKPRFLLAYDGNWFDRSSIIYLVDRIFKQEFY